MDRKLRVAQVITKMDVGGAQETALAICTELDPVRFEVTLISGPEGEGTAMTPSIAAAGVRHLVVRRLVRRISPLDDVLATVALWRLLRNERFDVVQTHSSKAGVIGRVAAFLARVPRIVHTVHGWSFRPGQDRAEFVAYRTAERLLAPITHTIVVVTSADIDAGLAAGVGRRGQYAVVRSGIDVDAWRSHRGRAEARAALGVPAGAPMVATVMRLAPPKDPVTLVRAVAGSANDPWLVVFGDGPMLEDARAEAERAGLDGRVRFAGLRRDVPDLLHAADVAVLSSSTEGLPRAVVEALAAGVPVVATDVGGVREVVRDGCTGMLVPVGDAEAMARAIDAVIERHDEFRAGIAAAGPTIESFSRAAMAAALERIYTA